MELIKSINANHELHDYARQDVFNDKIMEYAEVKLPESFDYSAYPNFHSLKLNEQREGDNTEEDNAEGEIEGELPF